MLEYKHQMKHTLFENEIVEVFRMKKKMVSVLLTAAMAATMFAGCGSNTDTKTDGGTQSADSKTDSGSRTMRI